jgi:hypothetical protein
MKDRFDKWNKWLDVINDEVATLAINRHIFWEVQNIIRNNEAIQKPSSFYAFLGSSYVALAVMAVRRQLKIDKTSISFARLLQEIIDTPAVISRARFVDLYKGSNVEDLADRDFDRFSADGKSYVDIEMVRADLEKLNTLGQGCEAFADKRIAHYDSRAPKVLPTFNELDACIDYLEWLLKKYRLLFRAEAVISVLPAWQYDWKEIFQLPWLPSEDEADKPNQPLQTDR